MRPHTIVWVSALLAVLLLSSCSRMWVLTFRNDLDRSVLIRFRTFRNEEQARPVRSLQEIALWPGETSTPVTVYDSAGGHWLKWEVVDAESGQPVLWGALDLLSEDHGLTVPI